MHEHFKIKIMILPKKYCAKFWLEAGVHSNEKCKDIKGEKKISNNYNDWMQ